MNIDPPTASIIVALIVAGGVAFNTWLTARSLAANNKNALDIAETKNIVRATDIKVDGNLDKWAKTMEDLIAELRARNVLEKRESFTSGAAEQRDAAPGVVVVAPPPPAV